MSHLSDVYRTLKQASDCHESEVAREEATVLIGLLEAMGVTRDRIEAGGDALKPAFDRQLGLMLPTFYELTAEFAARHL